MGWLIIGAIGFIFIGGFMGAAEAIFGTFIVILSLAFVSAFFEGK